MWSIIIGTWYYPCFASVLSNMGTLAIVLASIQAISQMIAALRAFCQSRILSTAQAFCQATVVLQSLSHICESITIS